MLRRYLSIVAVILVVTLGLAVWLKPPLDDMRKGVEKGLEEFAKQHPEKAGAPTPREVESHDWIVAVSYVTKLGDLTFACWGAFKVTVCTAPD